MDDIKSISEVVGVGIGFVVILYTALRSLLSFSLKKQGELEKLKGSFVTAQIEELKDLTKAFANSLSEVKDELIRITERTKSNQEAYSRVMEAFKDSVDSSNVRMKAAENSIVDLGRDVFMIKGKKK